MPNRLTPDFDALASDLRTDVDALIARAVTAERAAIVAWLREAAKKTRTRHAYLSVRTLADAIERGEHNRGGTE